MILFTYDMLDLFIKAWVLSSTTSIVQVDVVIGNNERIREILHVAGTVWISLSNSTKIVIFSQETRQILRVISLKVNLY